ncbi:quinoprotein relay system zinc metallohydrolase 2 [Caenispirillum bisanense]|uniref:quinoprotein relay system zinc metallohydrolase 2 n=1 Tax=Caenispirillum bisanense TaxID=414052 RepID=UPI0031DB9B38
MRRPPGHAAAALAVLLTVAATADAAERAVEPLPVTEAAPGVFVHVGAHEEADAANHGDIATLGFIVGAEAVAVVDTGGSPHIGQRLRAAVAAQSDRPVAYVINTHMHPDHVFGNAAFPEAQVIGHHALHAALAARFAIYRDRLAESVGDEEAAALAPLRVDVAVADSLTLDLGDRELLLTAHPTAHTNNDLTVLDRATGTLFTGDLLFVGRVPSLDGSLRGWLRVMDSLNGPEVARMVPGHGPVQDDPAPALAAQRRYLEGLAAQARRLIAGGGGLMQAQADLAPPDDSDGWLLLDDYHGRNVSAAFAELEWD